jgi:transposase
MNNKRNKRNYSQEFKDEAVRLLIDEGQSLEEVARKLDIREKELQQWKNKHIRILSIPYLRGHHF